MEKFKNPALEFFLNLFKLAIYDFSDFQVKNPGRRQIFAKNQFEKNVKIWKYIEYRGNEAKRVILNELDTP